MFVTPRYGHSRMAEIYVPRYIVSVHPQTDRLVTHAELTYWTYRVYPAPITSLLPGREKDLLDQRLLP